MRMLRNSNSCKIKITLIVTDQYHAFTIRSAAVYISFLTRLLFIQWISLYQKPIYPSIHLTNAVGP
jgi:hypothetical protein